MDNWEGYEIAMEDYERKQEIRDKIVELTELILEKLCMLVDTDLVGPGTGHGFQPEARDISEELIITWLEEKYNFIPVRWLRYKFYQAAYNSAVNQDLDEVVKRFFRYKMNINKKK